MARGLNVVHIIGNVGKDAELRYTQAGKSVASFSVATSNKWKGGDGEQHEQTEWHRIVAWGKLAEIAGKYVTKGRQAYVQGRLQTRAWEDREGNKKHTTEIVASEIILLGPKPEDNRELSREIFDQPQDSVGVYEDGEVPF